MEGGVKRYRFKLPDCAAIMDGLDAVDFCSLIVTPIFKKGRRNNAEDYRYVADPMVQWLCLPTANPEVRASNPG
jgi:hypothetical protein